MPKLQEIEGIIKDHIKPPEINDKFKASIKGCCVMCGYPLDKDLWNEKMKPLFTALLKWHEKCVKEQLRDLARSIRKAMK